MWFSGNPSELRGIGVNRRGDRPPGLADTLEVKHCGKGSPSCPVNGGRLRVLIADDNRDAADTLALLVGLWGHDVRQVYDGTAAIDMASVYHPDVCMLDIAMPGLDGSQVARQLRVLTGFGNLLLLAITGWTDEVHRLCSMKAGFEYYLIKPVEPLIIENLLLAHLARMASPPGILPGLLWKKTVPIVNTAVPYEYRGVIAGRDREAIGSGST